MKLYPPIRVVYDSVMKRERLVTSLEELIAWKSQGFGENPQVYAQFGIKGHNGLDWGLKTGTQIYAAHSGKVVYAGGDQSAGIGVRIEDDEKATIYWHMEKPLVSAGAIVAAGDIIGLSDNTGFSTGPHLHFGLKRINNGQVMDRDNGYDGAIDPTPYFVWWSMLTKAEMEALQALEGYHDPDGADFWVGKSLREYLLARLQHKLAQEQRALDNLS